MPAQQSLPQPVRAYIATQQRYRSGSVAAVRTLWRRMGEDFDRSWAQVKPQVLQVLTATQLRMSESAAAYVPAALEATSGPQPEPPAQQVPSALVGVAGDGRPVSTLIDRAPVEAKLAVASGATAIEALLSGLSWLTMATATLMSDTGRQAEVVGMGMRGVVYYTRALAPPSCSRCAVLAGAMYKSKEPFDRHPECDCRHVPLNITEDEAEDQGLLIEPRSYFDSLSESEQNRVFTNSGAEAIRHGADVNQVVNARRGMMRSQAGRITQTESGAFITGEGISRRGWANYAMRKHVPAGRKGIARLMPESIMRIAGGDPDETFRLLKKYGYIR